MLLPAYWLVFAFVAFAVLFWAGLLLWAHRTGLFGKSGEAVKYRVFDD